MTFYFCGTEITRAEIIELADSLYAIEPYATLYTCEDNFTLRYQVAAGEQFRIAIEFEQAGLPVEQTVSASGDIGGPSEFTLIGTGAVESVSFQGPPQNFSISVKQEITNRKGSIWSSVSLATVERSFSALKPGSLPPLVIFQQPEIGGNGDTLQTQPILTTTLDDGTRHCELGYDVEVVLSGAGGTLGGDTVVSVVNGVARFTDLELTGLVGQDYTLQFFLLKNELELRSETPVNSSVLKFLPPPNSMPLANAGTNQSVLASSIVTLDGSASSDPDGDTLTYAWTQSSGATVTLSSNTVSQPTFTAPTLAFGDADVTLVFSLTVNDGTVSSSADTVTITVEAPSPTPATAFAEYEEEIRATLVDDARRNLTSAMSANQRLIRDARGRMIETQQVLSGCNVDETPNNGRVGSELDTFECAPNSVSTRNYIPFDVNGTFNMDATTVSTSGNFFEQTGNFEGTQRRLFFGDFDVQHDADTDSTTATLTARVAWERIATDNTMLGYFVGAELATSNISGAFDGDQDRVAVTAGGYAVHQLADELYLDGFLSYGIGRNNLEMANDVLALTSDYTTRTATAGAAMSGVHEYEQYEFRPELAFSYGYTWIGNVGFTGRAYGLVDDTLSMDAGTVSIANLTLRPEVTWALDAETVAESNSQLSFAPRAICERTISTTRTENCGGGAELGLSSTSDDGLSTAEFRIIMDRVGSSNRSNFAVNVEHRF